MGKNVWLVVSDLHLYDRNISSMRDYVGEMIRVREQLSMVGLEYRRAGYESINLLLLGDVFHRSYKKVSQVVYDSLFFVLWNKNFGQCYSVVGNHELSFYEENPFFDLVQTIESEKIRKITNKIWQPKGLLPIVRVVDKVSDGEVTFHFNHFGTVVTKPPAEGVNVGLFHQEIVCNEILEAMQNQLQGKIWARTVDFGNLDVFDGYRYCFLGHMHKVYGVWKGDNDCVLYYLASLGRTNVGEINNRFLERNIPAIVVEDARFVRVEDHKFSLRSAQESVNKEMAIEAAHKYELQKLKKISKEYDVLSDDPVKSLKQYFLGDVYLSEVLCGLLDSEIDGVGSDIRAKFNRRFNL